MSTATVRERVPQTVEKTGESGLSRARRPTPESDSDVTALSFSRLDLGDASGAGAFDGDAVWPAGPVPAFFAGLIAFLLAFSAG